MAKSALGILFSILFICLAASNATAANEAGTTARSKKTVAKKHAVKRKAVTRKRVARANASLDSREKLVKRVVLVRGKRKVMYQRVAYRPVIPAVPPAPTAGDLAGLNSTRDPLDLKSNVALVVDQTSSEVLFEKNAGVALPIASITKLMTALVVIESHQNMDEILEISEEDVDRLKNSGSRLKVGTQLSRATMLHLALMSSENRAASALGRYYPGGLPAFVAGMNAKARSLGMLDTRFVDSNGLSSSNVASARDLAKLVTAAQRYPVLCQYSTDTEYVVETGGRPLHYKNTNHLVSNPAWEIGLQKTGYISEAGRCLVMQAMIEGRAVVMIFLDSKGKQSRLADASRIRKWLEALKPQTMSKNRLAGKVS
ncbi:MAG: D-alanyl-D-alanine endopeptidase [Burkholderiales bacterium]|nr:D-alanyl-D-alanine endopeptidase [Burkholderiales bacterium]